MKDRNVNMIFLTLLIILMEKLSKRYKYSKLILCITDCQTVSSPKNHTVPLKCMLKFMLKENHMIIIA